LRQNLPGEWANNSTFKKRYRQKIQKIPGFFWFTPKQCLVNKYERASMARTRQKRRSGALGPPERVKIQKGRRLRAAERVGERRSA